VFLEKELPLGGGNRRSGISESCAKRCRKDGGMHDLLCSRGDGDVSEPSRKGSEGTSGSLVGGKPGDQFFFQKGRGAQSKKKKLVRRPEIERNRIWGRKRYFSQRGGGEGPVHTLTLDKGKRGTEGSEKKRDLIWGNAEALRMSLRKRLTPR